MWRKSTKCEQGACAEVYFRTSSFCEGASCAEVGFEKSSFCDAGVCAEVHRGDTVLMRNNQNPDVVVEFDHDEWKAFVAGVKAGEFDL